MTKVHELKTWPKHFQAIYDGRKRFEFRYNDRDFGLGDFLYLREWEPTIKQVKGIGYTGRTVLAKVMYILTEDEDEEQPEFVPDGWCILSIVVVANDQSPREFGLRV